MLEVQELTKQFGRRTAVDRVTFTVNSGEIVGYLGPNGAGKSTTVKMLVAMLKPSSGRILFNGMPVENNLADFKMRLGYVPEEAVLYTHISGFEYLQLTGRLRGIEEDALTAKIDALLKACMLHPFKYSPIVSYSKGMKQKLMMLAALIHNPELLILDEPFSGLDVSSVLVFKKLLKSLAESGKTVILSSHVLEIIEKICNRVLIIHEGHLVADNSINNLAKMMQAPSLEQIFQQLVPHFDYDAAANDILSVIVDR